MHCSDTFNVDLERVYLDEICGLRKIPSSYIFYVVHIVIILFTQAYHDRPYPFNLMLGWSKGDVWKRIRTRLAPSFSPNKTKLMIGIFNKSADTCRSLFEEAVRSTGRIDIGEWVFILFLTKHVIFE